MLLTLAALWGAAYLFMRIGAPILGPFVLIFLRVSVAGAALFIFASMRKQKTGVLRKWKQYGLLGILNAAIPFSLISTAELHMTASLAATLNATTPLFTAVVAWIWTKDALTMKKIAGLLLGVAGVSVLVGWGPQHSGSGLFISVLLALLASISYAFAGVYSAKRFRGENPLNVAIGQQLGASVILLPFATAVPPHVAPSLSVVMAVAGLAILSTACAFPLYFALIRNVGPVKAISVTFFVPVFGVMWGAVFLGESVTPNIIIGLMIILVSVSLVANIRVKRKKLVSLEPPFIQ